MDKVFRIKDNKYKDFAKELYNHGALDKENYEGIMVMPKANYSKEIETLKKEDFEL